MPYNNAVIGEATIDNSFIGGMWFYQSASVIDKFYKLSKFLKLMSETTLLIDILNKRIKSTAIDSIVTADLLNDYVKVKTVDTILIQDIFNKNTTLKNKDQFILADFFNTKFNSFTLDLIELIDLANTNFSLKAVDSIYTLETIDTNVTVNTLSTFIVEDYFYKNVESASLDIVTVIEDLFSQNLTSYSLEYIIELAEDFFNINVDVNAIDFITLQEEFNKNFDSAKIDIFTLEFLPNYNLNSYSLEYIIEMTEELFNTNVDVNTIDFIRVPELSNMNVDSFTLDLFTAIDLINLNIDSMTLDTIELTEIFNKNTVSMFYNLSTITDLLSKNSVLKYIDLIDTPSEIFNKNFNLNKKEVIILTEAYSKKVKANYIDSFLITDVFNIVARSIQKASFNIIDVFDENIISVRTPIEVITLTELFSKNSDMFYDLIDVLEVTDLLFQGIDLKYTVFDSIEAIELFSKNSVFNYETLDSFLITELFSNKFYLTYLALDTFNLKTVFNKNSRSIIVDAPVINEKINLNFINKTLNLFAITDLFDKNIIATYTKFDSFSLKDIFNKNYEIFTVLDIFSLIDELSADFKSYTLDAFVLEEMFRTESIVNTSLIELFTIEELFSTEFLTYLTLDTVTLEELFSTAFRAPKLFNEIIYLEEFIYNDFYTIMLNSLNVIEEQTNLYTNYVEEMLAVFELFNTTDLLFSEEGLSFYEDIKEEFNKLIIEDIVSNNALFTNTSNLFLNTLDYTEEFLSYDTILFVNNLTMLFDDVFVIRMSGAEALFEEQFMLDEYRNYIFYNLVNYELLFNEELFANRIVSLNELAEIMGNIDKNILSLNVNNLIIKDVQNNISENSLVDYLTSDDVFKIRYLPLLKDAANLDEDVVKVFNLFSELDNIFLQDVILNSKLLTILDVFELIDYNEINFELVFTKETVFLNSLLLMLNEISTVNIINITSSFSYVKDFYALAVETITFTEDFVFDVRQLALLFETYTVIDILQEENNAVRDMLQNIFVLDNTKTIQLASLEEPISILYDLLLCNNDSIIFKYEFITIETAFETIEKIRLRNILDSFSVLEANIQTNQMLTLQEDVFYILDEALIWNRAVFNFENIDALYDNLDLNIIINKHIKDTFYVLDNVKTSFDKIKLLEDLIYTLDETLVWNRAVFNFEIIDVLENAEFYNILTVEDNIFSLEEMNIAQTVLLEDGLEDVELFSIIEESFTWLRTVMVYNFDIIDEIVEELPYPTLIHITEIFDSFRIRAVYIINNYVKPFEDLFFILSDDLLWGRIAFNSEIIELLDFISLDFFTSTNFSDDFFILEMNTENYFTNLVEDMIIVLEEVAVLNFSLFNFDFIETVFAMDIIEDIRLRIFTNDIFLLDLDISTAHMKVLDEDLFYITDRLNPFWYYTLLSFEFMNILEEYSTASFTTLEDILTIELIPCLGINAVEFLNIEEEYKIDLTWLNEDSITLDPNLTINLDGVFYSLRLIAQMYDSIEVNFEHSALVINYIKDIFTFKDLRFLVINRKETINYKDVLKTIFFTSTIEELILNESELLLIRWVNLEDTLAIDYNFIAIRDFYSAFNSVIGIVEKKNTRRIEVNKIELLPLENYAIINRFVKIKDTAELTSLIFSNLQKMYVEKFLIKHITSLGFGLNEAVEFIDLTKNIVKSKQLSGISLVESYEKYFTLNKKDSMLMRDNKSKKNILNNFIVSFTLNHFTISISKLKLKPEQQLFIDTINYEATFNKKLTSNLMLKDNVYKATTKLIEDTITKNDLFKFNAAVLRSYTFDLTDEIELELTTVHILNKLIKEQLILNDRLNKEFFKIRYEKILQSDILRLRLTKVEIRSFLDVVTLNYIMNDKFRPKLIEQIILQEPKYINFNRNIKEKTVFTEKYKSIFIPNVEDNLILNDAYRNNFTDRTKELIVLTETRQKLIDKSRFELLIIKDVNKIAFRTITLDTALLTDSYNLLYKKLFKEIVTSVEYKRKLIVDKNNFEILLIKDINKIKFKTTVLENTLITDSYNLINTKINKEKTLLLTELRIKLFDKAVFENLLINDINKIKFKPTISENFLVTDMYFFLDTKLFKEKNTLKEFTYKIFDSFNTASLELSFITGLTIHLNNTLYLTNFASYSFYKPRTESLIVKEKPFKSIQPMLTESLLYTEYSKTLFKIITKDRLFVVHSTSYLFIKHVKLELLTLYDKFYSLCTHIQNNIEIINLEYIFNIQVVSKTKETIFVKHIVFSLFERHNAETLIIKDFNKNIVKPVLLENILLTENYILLTKKLIKDNVTLVEYRRKQFDKTRFENLLTIEFNKIKFKTNIIENILLTDKYTLLYKTLFKELAVILKEDRQKLFVKSRAETILFSEKPYKIVKIPTLEHINVNESALNIFNKLTLDTLKLIEAKSKLISFNKNNSLALKEKWFIRTIAQTKEQLQIEEERYFLINKLSKDILLIKESRQKLFYKSFVNKAIINDAPYFKSLFTTIEALGISEESYSIYRNKVKENILFNASTQILVDKTRKETLLVKEKQYKNIKIFYNECTEITSLFAVNTLFKDFILIDNSLAIDFTKNVFNKLTLKEKTAIKFKSSMIDTVSMYADSLNKFKIVRLDKLKISDISYKIFDVNKFDKLSIKETIKQISKLTINDDLFIEAANQNVFYKYNKNLLAIDDSAYNHFPYKTMLFNEMPSLQENFIPTFEVEPYYQAFVVNIKKFIAVTQFYAIDK